MAPRKSLSKKTRFEVFKRDSFRCQYCGKSAPDVILHIDHIKPVAAGGDNKMTNLITSCFDCNMGKKDVPLDDNSALEKQKQQLAEINERRIQLEMMLQWRESMEDLDGIKVKSVARHWQKLTNNQASASENGIKQIKRMVKKYELNFVFECFETSANQYLRANAKGEFTRESLEKTFTYAEKIAASIKRLEVKPYLNELYYMRAILRKRLPYYVDYEILNLLERAHNNGAELDWLKELCCEAHNWTYFKRSLEQFEEGD